MLSIIAVDRDQGGVVMEDKLLGYMQWPEIEAIIYSEHDRPKQILGPHKVDEGVLVQAYFPGA